MKNLLRCVSFGSVALVVAPLSLMACGSSSKGSAAGGSAGTSDSSGGMSSTSDGGTSTTGSGGTSTGTSGSGGVNNSSSNGGKSTTSAGGASSGAGTTSTGKGGAPAGGGTSMPIPMVPGEVDPNAPAGTALPAVPRMVNVKATAIGDSVSISFDPIDGAVDYRVYELPANDDVSSTSDGYVTVKNAVYRCAGNRQAPAATLDAAPQVQSGAIHTLVDGQTVDGYKRTLDSATLGYVYAEPGDGRIPVYALGDGNPNADNDCYFQRWGASRLKQYVTSEDTRTQLLAKGFRDDGIVFYVPATAGSGTKQIYTSFTTDMFAERLYYLEGAEQQARKGGTAAFSVLSAAADGAVPLMRVFYANICGNSHDELVAGKPRFERARRQGDKLPVYDLHWSGLTKQTTLVVEALDQGCPYPGLLAPKSSPAYTGMPFNIAYQEWITPTQAQAASTTGEVFINGQFENNPKPRPIARSFVKIGPAAAPSLDWSWGYTASDTLPALADTDCGALDGNCFGQYRQKSTSLDVEFFNPEQKRYGQAVVFGELWVMYADEAADTNGKYRLTPATKADMAADTFIYASMDVDSFSTARRYPQILISDQQPPVQVHLPMGNTLVFQTFADWPNTYEVQVCDHKTWDVNDQCPRFDLYHQLAPNDPNKITGLAPNAEVGEHAGMDRSTRFEIYASTKRAYLFLDGQPYGCADLPKAGVPSGTVTVTFGDVLYHSDADQTFDFSGRRMKNDSIRHFDNLGYKSHVPAPVWDESRFPCATQILENN